MKRTRVPKASGLVLAMMSGLSACGGGGGESAPSATGQQAGTRLSVKLAPEAWIKCADEWGTCTFSGTTQVRYGLNGTWSTRTATGSIGCNNDVFGDPLPGADKVCEYVTITTDPAPSPTPAPAPAPAPAPSPAPTPAPSWSKCADEWQTCSFSGTRQVRYGLNGTWATRTATGSINCNNNVFGDPLPGADKICEVETSTPAPAPSPAPAPAPAPTPAPAPAPTPTPAPAWVKCADEWQTCAFTGTRQVRYGRNDTWVTRTATDTIACNNAVFGDPLPGVPKVCEVDSAAPSPAPTPNDCNAVIDQCFNLSAPEVTPYRGDTSSAASYTFDDGYASSATVAAIFEERGLRATFYIIPGIIDAPGWNLWRSLHGKGHEIGNHSMTHTVDMGDGTVSDQTLATEITTARDTIEQQLGARPLTFAFPWHSFTQKALQLAESAHFAVRKVNNGESNYEFAFFDDAHAGSLAEQLNIVNGQLRRVVDSGGWFVAGGHGVDGDGWSPVTSSFLRDHLAYARQFPSLWIDTYANVARYRLCRPQVIVSAATASSTRATVHLGGNFNGTLCNAPLTVSLPVKAPFNGSVSARSESGAAVPVTRTASKLLFDARPGETVIIDVAQ
ncbi:MAG TPA: polysaccharide deacetylase family protein [Noviherbaspirillum sp.]